jgi:hypothetical protein
MERECVCQAESQAESVVCCRGFVTGSWVLSTCRPPRQSLSSSRLQSRKDRLTALRASQRPESRSATRLCNHSEGRQTESRPLRVSHSAAYQLMCSSCAAALKETFQTEIWGIVEGGHDWDLVSMEIVAAKTAFVFNVLSSK